MNATKKELLLNRINKAIECNKHYDDVHLYVLLKDLLNDVRGLDHFLTDNIRLAIEYYEDSDVETEVLPSVINSKLVSAYTRLASL